MGYTHYWTPTRNLTVDEWSAFTSAMRDVVAIARSEGVAICDGFGAPGTDPVISSNLVILNGEDGPGDLSHESFCVGRTDKAWSFCKTARKPYDKVVTAALIMLDHVAPGAYETKSDGDADEWGPGLLLALAARPGWQLWVPPLINRR